MNLTHNEELEQEAHDNGVEVISCYYFKSPRIKGLYSDNTIALSSSIQTYKEKSCILAEELAHYYLTVGDITDQSKTENRKQEYKARLLAYDKKIGLIGIIRAYESGYINAFEMAEFLDVTEEFLNETLDCYRSKYGQYAEIDNYIVFFEPYFAVIKMI